MTLCIHHSMGTPLLEKVDKLAQMAIRRDSNTHLETFGDHSHIFYPEFSFHMKPFNPTMSSYMVSLKYDCEEFRAKHWLYTATSVISTNKLPVVPAPPDRLHQHMIMLLDMAKWIMQESINPKNTYPMTKTVVHTLISAKDACLYINNMYYSNSLNINGCASTFKDHLTKGIWSYYTLHLVMDVYDIHSVINCKNTRLQNMMPNTNKLQSNITIHLLMDFYNTQSLLTHKRFYMDESVLHYAMPNIYKLFLNITIQHVRHYFNNCLHSTFLECERDIDDILGEINAYIPQFTTKSDTPTKCEKWIFVAAFTVISGFVTAYSIYKSYTFCKNIQRMLHYILNKQKQFQQNVLSNKRYLLSLAEITSSNFKDVRSEIATLKADTNRKFDRYLHKLMHTSADSIFYKNCLLHYVNILDHLDHDLVRQNNRIERIKTTLHMKCRNFVSGLHLLARNQIPESILHADVFHNIL